MTLTKATSSMNIDPGLSVDEMMLAVIRKIAALEAATSSTAVPTMKAICDIIMGKPSEEKQLLKPAVAALFNNAFKE